MGYALLHVALVYLFQFAPIHGAVPTDAAAAVGLYVYYGGDDGWVAPIWPTYFLLPATMGFVVLVRAACGARLARTRQRHCSHDPAGCHARPSVATQCRLHQRANNTADELTLPNEPNGRLQRCVRLCDLGTGVFCEAQTRLRWARPCC